MRESLSESKKQNHVLTERAQNLQRAQEDSELRVADLEKQTRALQEVRGGESILFICHLSVSQWKTLKEKSDVIPSVALFLKGTECT